MTGSPRTSVQSSIRDIASAYGISYIYCRRLRLIMVFRLLAIILACLPPCLAFSPDPLLGAKVATVKSVVLRQQGPSSGPLRLFYYADDEPSFQSLAVHGKRVSLLAPQSYWIQPSGFVFGGIPPRVAKLARDDHIPLMPLVFNRNFDRSTVTAVLRNPQARTHLVSYLAYAVRRDHAVGMQIDFENIAPEDRANFSELVREAARRFHSEGKLLSVALPPKRIILPAIPGKPGTGTWAAAFDYREIGRFADFVTVMAYDQHGRDDPPGPVAGYDWVRQVLDYATSRIPAQKILLGVPFYGREWVETGGGTFAHTITLRDVIGVERKTGVKVRWDAVRQSPWFAYRQGNAHYNAWFENTESLKLKLALISHYKLRGFAAWRLGSEDLSVWTLPAVSGIAPRQARHSGRRLPRSTARVRKRLDPISRKQGQGK